MCRNIKRLRREAPAVSATEFEEAARNLVRKLSGYREPSAVNEDVFEAAVAEITRQSRSYVTKISRKKGAR